MQAPAIPDEKNLWLPPRRMLRYQWSKAVGGLLMGAIFAGWLVIQWSNPAMRWLAIALLVITAWVVIASCIADRVRAYGRQLAIDGADLLFATPDEEKRIAMDSIAYAQWREDELATAGLWLFDRQGGVLAHLDLRFLGDQDEARTFLHWARQRADLPFEVRWPEPYED